MVLEELITESEMRSGVKPRRLGLWVDYDAGIGINIDGGLDKHISTPSAVKILAAWISGYSGFVLDLASPALNIDFPATSGDEGNIRLFSEKQGERKFPLRGYNTNLVFQWLERFADQAIQDDFA